MGYSMQTTEERKERSKKYYLEHKEQRKIWDKEHSKERKIWHDAYYLKNRERELLRGKKWRQEHKKEQAISNKKYREEHVKERKIWQAKYWQEHKNLPEFKELRKKVMLRRKIKRQKILANLKINGCAICGYNKNPGALDFHHVNPKDKKFQLIGTTLHYKNFAEEVNKCILLCSNCHREIHYKNLLQQEKK